MIHASEQERPDVRAKREWWIENLLNLDANQLVFVDESGVNIDLTRRYGRSKGKTRVVDHVPLNTPQNITLLSSIRLDGSTVPIAFPGALNKERFLEYLEKHLIPHLRQGDIVIMDNLRTHKVDGVAKLIHSVGAKCLYLPPYSPDFNPIEKMWSKLKAYLRKLRPRSEDALFDVIPDAFSIVSSEDAYGWFRAAGYC